MFGRDNNQKKRLFSSIEELFTGETKESKLNQNWDSRNKQVDSMKLSVNSDQNALKFRIAINSYRKMIINTIREKVLDSDFTVGSYQNVRDANYYYFHSAVEAAKSLGVGVDSKLGTFTYKGQTIPFSELGIYDNEIRKSNENDLYKKILNGDISCNEISELINHYQSLVNQMIESEYEDLIKHMEAEERSITYAGNDISRREHEISQERMRINQEKTSFEAQRAQANANRFRRR